MATHTQGIVDIDALSSGNWPQAWQRFYHDPDNAQHISPDFVPRLEAARTQLADFRLQGYDKGRNHIQGNVSRLNPYITWGVFTLREVQQQLRGRGPWRDYQKFVNELAWKQYFRECHLALGERIYSSLEPYKYPRSPDQDLPEALEQGRSGLACMDSIVQELRHSGYLHNHKRMWFAAYTVHYANVAWWQGEALFYRYLLDGEPGANALSWQWVASTFSGKPYYFNNSNLRKFGHSACNGDPRLEASYEAIDAEVFAGYGSGGYAKRPKEQPQSLGHAPHPRLLRDVGEKPLLLLHAERLSDSAAVLAADPQAPVLVYLDGRRWQEEQPSFMRFHFAMQLAADVVRCLRQQGRAADVLLSDDVQSVLDYARSHDCHSLAAPDSWHPDTWQTLLELDQQQPVSVVPDEPFAEVATSLRSFSSFWNKAQAQVLSR